MQYLSGPEIRFYFCCHVAFIVYAIYNVFAHRKEIYSTETAYHSFEGGWRLVGGGHKDVADYEWENWKRYLWETCGWYGNHILMNFLIAKINLGPILPYCHVCLTTLFLVLRYGLWVALLLCAVNVTFYAMAKWQRSVKVVWSLAVLCLLLLNAYKTDTVYLMVVDLTDLPDTALFEIITIVAWGLLKCISYSLDAIEKQRAFQLKHFMAYVLYFPTLVLGPTMVYERFERIFTHRPHNKPNYGRFFDRVASSLFWWLVLEVSLHFVYVHSLQQCLEVVGQLDRIALFGYGYLLGQYFHVKYVVVYGLGIALAELDGIEALPKPICVARVHKYSDMWKHFDRGLYEFLHRHIYTRMQWSKSSPLSRLAAVFVTFVFIYIWHGYFRYVLVWALLNFVGLLLESGWATVQRSHGYRKTICRFVGAANQKRLDGIVGTQLLILAVIANFFFLATYEVGLIFVQKTYMSGLLNYLALSVTLAFIYFTSEHLKRNDQSRCLSKSGLLNVEES